MPGSKLQINPCQQACEHVPKNTEERNQNPQDEWCDQCQMALCRNCKEQHIKNGCKTDGMEQTRLINKIRVNLEKNESEIKKVKSKLVRDSLKYELSELKRKNKERMESEDVGIGKKDELKGGFVEK